MKIARASEVDPTMGQSVNLYIGTALEQLHTCIPGRIAKYDPTTQKANVQPVVGDYYWNHDTEKLDPEKYPMCAQVPIVWPSSNDGASITFPLKKGDPVLLVFSERSIAEYLVNGNKDNQPSSARAFDLSDAFAIPGGRSFNHSSGHAAPIPAEGLDERAVVVRGPAVHVRAGDGSKMELGADVTFEGDGTTLEVGGGFAFSNDGEELLAVIEEMRVEIDGLAEQLAVLAGATVPTAIGPQALSTGVAVGGAAGAIRGALATVKTKLLKLTR